MTHKLTKMANKEQGENALTQYRRQFDIWLYNFKETDNYANMVADYEECWHKIYKELHLLFKQEVWYPMKYETWTKKDDDPRLKNYKRQFDEWLWEFKKTSDYFGLVASYNEDWSKIYSELHRIFKMNVRDAEN